uniref:Uncharacterized protein n=1 Tax=Arundo donax TaxID=35708 RepID=A0A0A9HA96_ARUDO
MEYLEVLIENIQVMLLETNFRFLPDGQGTPSAIRFSGKRLATFWVPKELFASNGSENSWNPAYYFHSVGCKCPARSNS